MCVQCTHNVRSTRTKGLKHKHKLSQNKQDTERILKEEQENNYVRGVKCAHLMEIGSHDRIKDALAVSPVHDQERVHLKPNKDRLTHYTLQSTHMNI